MKTKRPLLIGLHGLAEVGKTTAARHLCNMLSLRRYIIALPITEACAATICLRHDRFLDLPKSTIIEPFGINKRQLMQRMGDLLISENPRALITHVEKRIQRDDRLAYLFNGNVIEDVRTEAEAQWVRDNGGFVVHIIKPDAQRAPSHRTERGIALAMSDILLRNDGSLNDFYNRLQHAADAIRLQHGALQEAS